jgi:hypothetical protein
MLATLFHVAAAAAPATGLPPFGSRWFKSDTGSNVTVAGDALVWRSLVHPRVLMTYLPTAHDVSADGAAFTASLRWLSDGANACAPQDWADHRHCACAEPIAETCAKDRHGQISVPECAHTSVNCLAGTGDFRIALWDTSTNKAPRVTADGFAQGANYGDVGKILTEKFKAYRGYNFRIDPHVSTKYRHIVETEPGGFYAKVGASSSPFDSKHRLKVFSGFEAPLGNWTDLTLEVKRERGRTFKVAVTLAGVHYEHTHTWGSDADTPRVIDAIGIWYPNGRAYSVVQLANGTSPVVGEARN